MAQGHHFEATGTPVSETSRTQSVKCIYCETEDTYTAKAFSQGQPKPLAERLYEARTVPADAECPYWVALER
jgi:hypothetical protein